MSHPQDPHAQQPYQQQAYQQPAPGQQPYPPQQPGYAPVPAPGMHAGPHPGYSDKSKLVAGLLQIFLGGFGVGRFYTGHTGMAIGMIAATWLTCGIGGLWPLIDGIMLLAKGGTDAQGRVLRD